MILISFLLHLTRASSATSACWNIPNSVSSRVNRHSINSVPLFNVQPLYCRPGHSRLPIAALILSLVNRWISKSTKSGARAVVHPFEWNGRVVDGRVARFVPVVRASIAVATVPVCVLCLPPPEQIAVPFAVRQSGVLL